MFTNIDIKKCFKGYKHLKNVHTIINLHFVQSASLQVIAAYASFCWQHICRCHPNLDGICLFRSSFGIPSRPAQHLFLWNVSLGTTVVFPTQEARVHRKLELMEFARLWHECERVQENPLMTSSPPKPVLTHFQCHSLSAVSHLLETCHGRAIFDRQVVWTSTCKSVSSLHSPDCWVKQLMNTLAHWGLWQ